MSNTKIIKEQAHGGGADVMSSIFEACNRATASGTRKGPILAAESRNLPCDESRGDLKAKPGLYERAKGLALHNALLSDDPQRPYFESAEFEGYEGISAPPGLYERFSASDFGHLTRPDVRIFPEQACGHCVVALYDREDDKLYPYDIVETKEVEKVFHFNDGGKKTSIVAESLAEAQLEYDRVSPIEDRYDERPDLRVEDRRADKLEGPFKVVIETRDQTIEMGPYDDPSRAFHLLVREMKDKKADGKIVGDAGKEWLQGKKAKEHDVFAPNVDQGMLNKQAMSDAIKEGRTIVVGLSEDSSMQGIIGSTAEKLQIGQDFVVEKSDESLYGTVVDRSQSMAFVEMKKAADVHPKKVSQAPRIGFSFDTHANRPGGKEGDKLDENSSEGSTHYREVGTATPDEDGLIPVIITDYGTKLDGKFGITGVLKAKLTKDEIDSNKRFARTKNQRDHKSYIKIEYIGPKKDDEESDKPEDKSSKKTDKNEKDGND